MSGNQGCCHSSSVSQVGNQSFIRMPKWRGFDCQQASGCESPSCWCALFLDVPLPAQYSFFSTRNNDLLVVTELEIDTFFLSFPYIYTHSILSGGQVFFVFCFLSWKCQLRLDNTLHTSPCCGLQHKQSLFSVPVCWKGSFVHCICVFTHWDFAQAKCCC